MAWTRSPAVTVVLGACSSACALLFGLDGYGPGSDDPDVPADAAADARGTTDVGAGAEPSRTPSYHEVVMRDGPLAYFRFEEQTGTSCKNEVSGSPLQCAHVSGPITPGAPGIGPSGRAIRLDSLTARLQFVGGMPFSGDEPFTLEAWVNIQEHGSSLFNDLDEPTRTGHWTYWDSQKRLVTETWSGATHILYTTSSSPLPAGRFVHVVYVYSDTERKDVLYVDAVEGVGERLDAKPRVASKMALVWGGFSGSLDEVAIYAKALSPERIAAHYAARSNP